MIASAIFCLLRVVMKTARVKSRFRKYQLGIAVRWASTEPRNWVDHSPCVTSLPPYMSSCSGAAALSVNHMKSSITSMDEKRAPVRIMPGRRALGPECVRSNAYPASPNANAMKKW